MNKSNFVLGLSVATLAACGGGGGGGGGAPSAVRPTVIAGVVTPPATVGNGIGNTSTTILTPPNTTKTWDTITQSADYTFDPAAANAVPSTLKAVAMNIKPVDTTTGSFTVTTGAAYPTDMLTGKAQSITNTVRGQSTVSAALPVQSTLGGLPATVMVTTLFPTQPTVQGYVLPYSATLNPAGYVYQTFGSWITKNQATGQFTENYFSAGVIANPAALPAAGTASYSGAAGGTWVNAATRDMYDTVATMNATADFGTRTVAFSTTGTTSLSVNAPAGTAPTANPGLNLNGTLSYAAGSSTFTGPVSTVSGMTGNATGRFYGPGIVSATANQVLGAPPEIGGTFAVMTPGVGAMQGAFGGSGSHPPTIVPSPVAIQAGLPTATPNTLLPVNTAGSWYAIVQSTEYTFTSATNQMVSTFNASNVETSPLSTITIQTGAVAYPADPTLGQTTAVNTNTTAPLPPGIVMGGPAPTSTKNFSSLTPGTVVSQTVLAGMPAVTMTESPTASVSYVMPFSTTMNPTGFTYQTFGVWSQLSPIFAALPGAIRESYFSTGAVTATLPVVGTAAYIGAAAGSFVNAATHVFSHTTATMNATADFAARTVAFSTTGTTSLSNNAPVGTAATANAGLNMTGTLTYAAGSNTFTGPVTTANGMSGNATGRFYGPGIAVATPTKAVGAPPEIGGTFAVMTPGVGAMQGAFGGK